MARHAAWAFVSNARAAAASANSYAGAGANDVVWERVTGFHLGRIYAEG